MLPPIAGDLQVSELDLPAILATIRQTESGGNYQAQARGASASGAYQYVDSTWAGYGGYARAKDAPPEVQDARAAADVRRILAANNGSAAAVFVSWYWPRALNTHADLDMVPMPGAGNKLTVRKYAELQLGRLAGNLTNRWPSIPDVPNPFNPAELAGAAVSAAGWAGGAVSNAVGSITDTAAGAVGRALLYAVLVAGGMGLLVLGARQITKGDA